MFPGLFALVPRRRGFAALALAGLLGAGSASATTLFTIDPAASTLTVMNASFINVPTLSFPTTIEPVAGSDFARSLAGSVMADATSGALESADLQVLGAALEGDQILIDRRGNGRDVGDLTLMALGIDVDAGGIATFDAGFLDFDVSLGSFRVRSPAPLSLVGVHTAAQNLAGPPTVTRNGNRVELDLPISLSFDQVTVIQGGSLSMDLVGSIHAVAIVPEPSTSLLVATGLTGLALQRRGRRQ